MVIEDFINNKLKRSDYDSDDAYYSAKNSLRSEITGNLLHSDALLGEYKDSDYKDGLKGELYDFFKKNNLIIHKSVGSEGVTLLFDSDEYAAAKGAYSKIADIQKFLSSYMFEPLGAGGTGGTGVDGGTDAVDSITSGGKSVKNFNITINDGLIKQVDNHFASTNESPETAGDFMWKVSQALQMMLNDINYTAK
jgi:hypothetical protein